MNANEGKRFDRKRRILLTGVFGPYGVDDDFGRKENIMELFHNQVTKAQGVSSFRFHHRSFGLYFIAANIDADVTVLDFPSRKRFVRELRRGYDIVGISFITPNFVKAREMARLSRLHSPGSTIILGGHGAAIEGIEKLIDCDHVARGEGIRWMRRFLGQNPGAPIYHPTLPSAERESIFGVPLPGRFGSLLAPGVGCVNGCKFCSTSHFFGCTYTPFLSTGKELYELACRIADERRTDDFFIMDENFLKDRVRALELLAEMEKHQRFFRFHVFSSAEAVTAFGLENLVRLGVTFLWLGVECSSPQENFEKNRGLDMRRLIRELREHGIMVLASGILCMEHHTAENIQADIDFMVGLKPDLVQFMLLSALPVTALYEDFKRRGLLRNDLPFEEWHGQKELNFRHPHFSGEAAQDWLEAAFRKDFEVNSSSMYRVLETSLRDYLALSAITNRDTCLEQRRQELAARTRGWAPMLAAVKRHAVNEVERSRALELDRKISAALRAPSLMDRLRRIVVLALAGRWKLRLRFLGDTIQPSTIVTRFKSTAGRGGQEWARVFPLRGKLKEESQTRVSAAVHADSS